MPLTSAAHLAQVAELVDAHGSGPCAARRGGSSPLLGTKTLREFPRFLQQQDGKIFLRLIWNAEVNGSDYLHRIFSGRPAKMVLTLPGEAVPGTLPEQTTTAVKPLRFWRRRSSTRHRAGFNNLSRQTCPLLQCRPCPSFVCTEPAPRAGYRVLRNSMKISVLRIGLTSGAAVSRWRATF